MSPSFGRVLGIDFSGARDAGLRTWIAIGRPSNGRLLVSRVMAAKQLASGGVDRDVSLAALRQFLSTADRSIAGLDFPFSLPADLLGGRDWPTFAADFVQRWPDAEAFREDCMRQTGGREIKRLCDREARTPFAAYNLRLYRQTYFGIAHLLAPLARDGKVRIAPLMSPPRASTTLVEACPASLLKRLDTYPSYKGRTPAHAEARRRILNRMGENGVMPSAEVADVAVNQPGGDALDAIAAALCAWRAAMDPQSLKPREGRDAVEGRVYF